MTFELQRVSAGYHDNPVLHDVTLTVPEGRTVALLGPNGAGKTTLLRVASGLLSPSGGNIRVGNRTLLGERPDGFARAGICHIPEGRAIFRTMTVRENLLLQARNRGGDDSLADVFAAFPRLRERLNQVAGTMSGGEQQMLAMATAYLSYPSFVFCDEVSLGLAPRVVDEIYVFLESLATRGVALLIVEQYAARVLRIADFVYMINRGRIVFAGEPHELSEEEVFNAYIGAEASSPSLRRRRHGSRPLESRKGSSLPQ
jgi:branched-chain amino acid transport system ATP-binding protein